jgi:integrase
MRLSESVLAKIDLGNKSEVQYRDDKVTGFAVRARKLSTGSIRRDFLVMWQERTPSGKRISKRVFIGQHGNPWTLEAARAEAVRLLQAREAGERVETAKTAAKSERLVSDLVPIFDRLHMPSLKPQTARDYRQLIAKRILPAFGKYRVSEIRRADVQDWVGEGRETPVHTNRAYAVLSKMMAFAVEREWRLDNPCIGVRKHKETARDRWLNESELPKFIKALATEKTAHADLIRFLTVSGWRVSEALGLTWAMVDTKRLVANLPDTKTGAQERALSGDAVAIIDDRAHRSGFVFSTRGGGSPLGYKQVREALQRVCELAGIDPITPHDLRHTAASWAALGGAQAHELREGFGWKTLAMTGRYVGRAESLGRRGVERAAGAIRIFDRGNEAES